jgi:putative Holliday junction resolvase
MRILGIDTGERRVGFAVSDPLGITAQGLETFDARAGIDLVDHIRGLVERYAVEEIVVGHPVGLMGQEGDSSRRASELAGLLRERLGVRVTMWDERFSSEEAKRVLRGQRARKGVVDRLAAVIILQSYLEYRRRSD